MCPQYLLFVINLTEAWEASLVQFVPQHYEFSFLGKAKKLPFLGISHVMMTVLVLGPLFDNHRQKP